MKKLVIGVQLNESTSREPNPHVPFTPLELARDLAACERAGASLSHFHARTEAGGVDHSTRLYGECIAAIREHSDVLLVPSLANAPGYTLEERVANIVDNAADPRTRADFFVVEMGCAAMDQWDPAVHRYLTEDRMFLNGTATQRALLAYARRLQMPAWMVSFNVSWTRAIAAHLAAGEVGGRPVVQFVLGGPDFPAAHPDTRAGLRAHLEFLPSGHDVEWFVSAYRGDVLALAGEVIRDGGHLAIGVGDHHYADLGLPTNAELVAKVAELSRELGREVATPAEARQILGLPAPAAVTEPSVS